MREYDVVVVGAGPAGLPAARAAAEAGAKTVVFEKNPVIAAFKPCGEATSLDTFRDLGISPRPHIVLRKVRARVYAPNGTCFDLGVETCSINKTAFLQELAVKAAEAGAEIRVAEPVRSVERSRGGFVIKTRRGAYWCRVVIGADGYRSTVARCLGVAERSEPIPTLVYHMANVELEEDDVARFYLGRSVAPRGYAWIFPRTEGIAEVGIGVRGAPLKEHLDRFVQMHSDELGRAQVIDFRAAVVPIGGMIEGNVGDGFILIGDAAGTVIPLTGAGIRPSGVAGLIAGEVAAKAAIEGDTSRERLMEFRRRYEKPWGERIRKSLKIMRVLEGMSDEELNMLAEAIQGEDIIDMAVRAEVRRVALKLLRHPRLAAKFARALL